MRTPVKRTRRPVVSQLELLPSKAEKFELVASRRIADRRGGEVKMDLVKSSADVLAAS
jgi:hypothetical protein